ncbi:uncharacterized protein LOC129594053 [Paramacrobiotus metropolitanus]|uniref:uncharacterized protein LOC129594053 n=1 Tax=Paramacrobiotus metropolitanus TaxID=2943436 RepID=UPI002445743C|nr:uncharacterized protein LOC129594053 [Paramacrobiotus metropolitanus]
MANHDLRICSADLSDGQQSGPRIPEHCTVKCVITRNTWKCVKVALCFATFTLLTTLVRFFLLVATAGFSEDFIINDIPEPSRKKVWMVLQMPAIIIQMHYFLHPVAAMIEIIRIFVHLQNFRQSSAVLPNMSTYTTATAYWWKTCQRMYDEVRSGKYVPIVNMGYVASLVFVGFTTELLDGQRSMDAHKRIFIPMVIMEMMNFAVAWFYQKEVNNLGSAILEEWYHQKTKVFVACTDDNMTDMAQLLWSTNANPTTRR